MSDYIKVLVVQSNSNCRACKICKGCEETALVFQFTFLQLTEVIRPEVYPPAWIIILPVKRDFMQPKVLRIKEINIA